MHWDPIFTFLISDQDRREWEEGVRGYSSTRTLLVNRMEKPENFKYCHCRAPLDMWVVLIVAGMHPEEPCHQMLVIPKMGGAVFDHW